MAMDAPQQGVNVFAYRIEVRRGGSPVDVAGFDVEARDGHIGQVDQASYDDDSSSLVVDTGFWIFGKKRMVPAGVVRAIDADEKKVYVTLTKDEIKGAPDYDEDSHRRDEPGYHDEVGRYYDPWGGTPPMEGA